ncbi:MAG: GIY-YIG nuclease family protein [Prochloraceae cyanobacterium]|nr:GIY-YIG nuclease family protein [Prochloraceae cyanobacterium]
MSREALIAWKQSIFKYQQQIRNNPTPQQNQLFNLNNASGSFQDIDPFSLKLHTSLFYRMPEPQNLVDGIDTGCIYFIIDNTLPVLLYVGETKLTATKRWKGTHYAKQYILNYIELHRKYKLDVAVVSAFWHKIPPDKKMLLNWEKELIVKWRSPFNKESWQFYGQPFGK